MAPAPNPLSARSFNLAGLEAASPSINFHLILSARVESILPTIATIIVFTRLYLRVTTASTKKFRLEVDDYLLAFSLFFVWAFWAMWYWTVTNLIGDDLLFAPPENIEQILHMAVAISFLYYWGITVVKFAIAFFYLRAFGTTRKTRIGVFILFGCIGAYLVITNVLIITNCTPFDSLWGAPGVFCGHDQLFPKILASIAVDWTTELMLLCFPIPLIWGLTLSTRKKIGVLSLFLVGGLTCSITGVNLYWNIMAYRTSTGPYLMIPKLECANLTELAFAIISASLPAMRQPVNTVVKKWKHQLFPTAEAEQPQVKPKAKFVVHGFSFMSDSEGTTATVSSV